MSKTDKTHPHWVKLAQNPQWRVEDHNHRKGVCDIDNFNPKTNNYLSYRRAHCYFWFKKGIRKSIWPREGSWGVKMYTSKHIKSDRNEMRMQIRDWVKSNREDVYDSEFGNYQTRHRAIWEAW